MKKRRSKDKLSVKGLASRQYRDDAREEKRRRAGIAALPRIADRRLLFQGQRRDALVDRVAGVMAGWSSSKFEFEGSMRAGLRSTLCLRGVGWASADQEAVSLTESALTKLGAVRPRWEEGQPEHLIGAENCLFCGRSLDETSGDFSRHRFCSQECARAMLERRNFERSAGDSEIGRAAIRMLRVLPPRECPQCGKDFRPQDNHPDQAYCSKQCSDMGRRFIPDIACLHCGVMFHPPYPFTKFCSQPCAFAHRGEQQIERVCGFCGAHFVGQTTKATYCSNNCKKAASALSLGKWQPKRIKPTVFDHFITMEVDQRPPWLTPVRFDELVAA